MKSIVMPGLAFTDTFSPCPEEFFPSHMHNEYELYYFLEGDLDYTVGGSVYRLKSRDLLVIPPAVHHFYQLRSKAPYRRRVINFSDEILPAFLREPLKTAPVCTNVAAGSAIDNAFTETAVAAERYPEEDARLAVSQYLLLIVLELKNVRQNAMQPSAYHPLLTNILAYIDENLSSPMDISSLAEKFAVSPSWLTHNFKRCLNVGVMRYVNEKKLLRAQQLIRNGLPPTQAAETCGFISYSAFFRLYRGYLHVSPKDDKWMGVPRID